MGCEEIFKIWVISITILIIIGIVANYYLLVYKPEQRLNEIFGPKTFTAQLCMRDHKRIPCDYDEKIAEGLIWDEEQEAWYKCYNNSNGGHGCVIEESAGWDRTS